MAGSVLAAVSATVVTSRFGVAGTVVGAAVASTVATVGTALYVHFFRTGSTVLATSGARLLTGGHPGAPAVRPAHRRALALAVAPLVVCAVALGGITTLEAFTGRTLSGLLGWQHSDTGGTSIGRAARSVEGRGVTPVRHSRSIPPTAGPATPAPPAPTTPNRGPASPTVTSSIPTTAPSTPTGSAPASTSPAGTTSAPVTPLPPVATSPAG